MRQDPRAREQELRNYLGGFDFRGDMADAPVEPFSGGEKSRLALALLVRKRPNLLLLDEPTNHLDLEMRHALTRALAGYEGSLVLVSHDRALLRTVCDSFLLVADGRAMPFDGDLEDYLAWLTARRDTAPAGCDRRGRAGATRDPQGAARNRGRGAAAEAGAPPPAGEGSDAARGADRQARGGAQGTRSETRRHRRTTRRRPRPKSRPRAGAAPT